ncbi:MAG TPA: PIN domain-containing protein [archaeon]|nr:PIN domain-containing protein [archaeon]
MKVIIDANILFSALLKKGLTRRVLFIPEIELYSPEFLFEELAKYRNYLLKKFLGKPEEFELLLELLTSQIKFIADKELKPFLPASASLIEDSKDWLYLACALKEDAIIWSNDKSFKKQKRIKTFTTIEMKKEFGIL